MNNPSVLKAISAIAFVISAIFTIRLFISSSVGITACILSALMALVLEIAKVGFFYEGLTNRLLNPIIRGTLITISVALVLSSMFASSAYVQNEANKTKNKEIQTSTQYKQAEESRTMQKDLYSQKKSELAALQQNKINTINELTKVRDSYPKNYFTVKENLTREMNKKSAEIQNKIDAKSSELSTIAGGLSSPIDTTKLNVLESKGYSGIFKLVAGLISTEEAPVDPFKLELFFFIILGVIFEAVAILSAYLSQLKSPRSIDTPNVQQITSPSRKMVFAKKDNQIGFQAPSKNFTSDDINVYLDYMYNNAKDDVSPGYIKISNDTSLPIETCRKIKAHLEHLNVIGTVNRSTKIFKPKHEISIWYIFRPIVYSVGLNVLISTKSPMYFQILLC